MMANRLLAVLIVLVAITGVMQGIALYQQQRRVVVSTRTTAQPVRDAPAGTTIDTVGLPSEGSKQAKVALVEFSDYECPFCSRYSTGAGTELRTEYVKTGKLVHVFVNNPLPVHPAATLLATSAICAGAQGRYWEMHDLLFSEGV